MVVALIALVAAFAGPAVASEAVDFARSKLISGSSIKKRSISGNRLRNNTLSGTQILESRLGKVPSSRKADRSTTAASASSAGNANSLGGVAASEYSRRLWAVVEATNPDVTIVRGSGATTAGRVGTGDFFVTFNQNITKCAYIASAANVADTAAPNLYATVEQRDTTTSPNDVAVRTWNAAGNPVDPGTGNGFHLAVFC
jgi:hypothetical protein